MFSNLKLYYKYKIIIPGRQCVVKSFKIQFSEKEKKITMSIPVCYNVFSTGLKYLNMKTDFLGVKRESFIII